MSEKLMNVETESEWDRFSVVADFTLIFQG